MNRLLGKYFVMKFLVFGIILFNCHLNSFAQGDPYYDYEYTFQYKSIFDFEEEDLYINNINRLRHSNEENSYFLGNLNGYSLPAPPKRYSTDEAGVPDPPPPPDTPINSHLLILIFSGLLFGVKKIFFQQTISRN